MSAPLKLSLHMSLVESPNSFSVHVAPPSVNAVRIVASVFFRALRRIAGAHRYERVEHAPSDLDIRRKLRATSYDCIMVRGRLRYVARLIPGHNRQLFWPCCLFDVANRLPLPRGSDQRMRTCTLRGKQWRYSRALSPPLPPDLESPFWIGSQIVKSVHFSSRFSMTELLRRGRLPQRWAKLTNAPSVTAKFAPERALAVDAQRAHGYRTEWSKRIDASGVCPACKAIFQTRLRVLSHVRSSACRAVVVTLLEHPEEAVLLHRKADAVEILCCRRDGRSAPAARTSATSQDGKARSGGISRL